MRGPLGQRDHVSFQKASVLSGATSVRRPVVNDPPRTSIQS